MLVTKPKAIRLLEEIVRGNEEKTADCYYVNPSDGKTPGCIIGNVLHRLDPEILVKVQQVGAGGKPFDTLLVENPDIFGDVKFTKPAAAALTIAQEVQDGRAGYNDCNWGNALEQAKKA